MKITKLSFETFKKKELLSFKLYFFLFLVLIYIGFPAAMALKLKEHLEIRDNVHIISSHLRFHLMEIYLMTELKICGLIGLTVVATFLVAN